MRILESISFQFYFMMCFRVVSKIVFEKGQLKLVKFCLQCITDNPGQIKAGKDIEMRVKDKLVGEIIYIQRERDRGGVP